MVASIFDNPVVIVGAGVAGLVCAHLLAQAGVRVAQRLREAGDGVKPRVGGG